MHTDHVKMLYDISELNNLFTESISIESFLQKIVQMVAGHVNADVCSIYLYNESDKELVLKATVGLKSDSVNRVKLKLGEGLVGLSLLNRIPVCEKCAEENPNFKFYPGINEEFFKSFLAVPIVRGNIRIGVMVVQRSEGKEFAEQDILALRATASQLASMIENIKYIMSPGQKVYESEEETNPEDLKFIKGRAGSAGYAYSNVVISNKDESSDFTQYLNTEEHYTIKQFDAALKTTEIQMENLQEKVEEKLEDAASLIFSAHLLMLKDTSFTGSMRKLIEKGEEPLKAILRIYYDYRDIFRNSPSLLIREKVQDVEDITKRIINNLMQKDADVAGYSGRIAVVRDILPSELLAMSAENIKGAILVSGGVTSHVSILARSLGIPLVIADKPELLKLSSDTKVLIDADLGNIYVNPAEDIVESFERKKKDKGKIYSHELLSSPSRTSDGKRIYVMANLNLLSDLKNIRQINNDGIGLYRTEFPFIIRNNFPSEEEQFFIYGKLVSDMGDKPVTFRTLDIGGDKILSYYRIDKEENPFLGMRSIRFSLSHREIFKQQIRAILRAGYEYRIKLMFPMISSIDEFLLAKELVHECIAELGKEGFEHNSSPETGIMVEIPSIVNIIEAMAEEADFFSIGTNDLIQYTLAVDRTNEKVADLYIPHHPAILKSLKRITDAGIKSGIDVSICGDMASDVRYIPFLIGIGISVLSVDSGYLPKVKSVISKLSFKEAETFANELLSKNRISEIDEVIKSHNTRLYGSELFAE
ncbi:MAG: phosphoenolpyruvate--protein phosphotransferase [Spirochaetes bacterium]|nr:phosphoenolpyruvate--protein phosphotransferase [Spirochaetota bacterium]